jgi:hypothetical protein
MQLYGTQGYIPDTKCGNTVGYASFLEEYARYEDLTQFEKVYAPYSGGNVRPYSTLAYIPNLSKVF